MPDGTPEQEGGLAGLGATAAPADPKDETIAYLQMKVQSVEDKALEERFIWLLVGVILFDCLVFSDMESWTGPLVIGILELIGLVVLADRCGVNSVMPLIDRLGGFLGNNNPKSD